MTASAAETEHPRTRFITAITTGAVVAAVASAANVLVSVVARGPFGASEEFVPLSASAIIMWTVIGVIVGAVGWYRVVTTSTRGRALLRTLVPVVLALSFIPDAALLFTDETPGQTTGGVIALMLMHVVTAAIAVSAYRRAMPPA